MAWNPWGEADPVEKRRRELEAKARQLEEETAALQEKLTRIHQPAPEPEKIEAPKPVWRADEVSSRPSSPLPTRPSRGQLRAHRQRDRNFFILLLITLVFVLGLIVRCSSH
jgi:hypothetical protein